MPRHLAYLLGSGSTPTTEPVLSEEEVFALRQACAPVGLLRFPPAEVIRTLRQHGYVEIVIGGIQITSQGLERLLRDRQQRQLSKLR